MSPSTDRIILPDLAAICPFPWRVNPHYERAREESSAWVESYMVRAKSRKVAFLKACVSELLASLTYSYANFEQLRLSCDFLNLLFDYDEFSDELDGDSASTSGTIFLKTINGEKTQGSVLSDIVEDFMIRFAEMSPNAKCLERFKVALIDYINAVSEEADLRKNERVLDTESYIPLRRENSGVRACFGFFELIHGTELPDEVFEDPIFQRMYWYGVDLVCFANDLFSYKMERAKGLDGNNYVTVVMREKGLGLQEAADFVASQFKQRLEQFVEDRKNIRSFGEDVDRDVQKYLFSISQWCIGSIVWSFKTPRYFGADYEEVKRTLVVKLIDVDSDTDSDSESESGDFKHYASHSISDSWIFKVLSWSMRLLK
ncbi:terpenoid synthase [Schizopora paradoxa]|uniref:Terpene synthase n=1 Tax=Schizopora paradoxa TaxID=27342 RepID=A0A0H2S2K1_9AGAM|nr:terpenoid synthase [Schizopora paradoxa]